MLNSDNLKAHTASRATLGKGERSGKEIHTSYSELFQNILTTEKVCKYLKKRTVFDSHLCSLKINVHDLTTTCCIMGRQY